ncbi:iron-containing alcohol dehydrogenase [Sulfuricella denitrificans skB26]|uniref:Iron-containing alcohol dehydrogenase n=1 Tax=Sulfuricella denitrificans (strain DSM 22764 / NBRC 105220 / skB26) TaxID=1163617 RepID=S6B2U3_SULDS|nr:iron-containing alcohol dehydrogenase [Sulfuricella denitrificans]BAN34992.1 iron-containing alcohol dehydrogenase [Sulfuricella denitrificans skB26]
MISPFSISGLPKIIFGEGRLSDVPELLQSLGKRVLIVTGGRSFRASLYWQGLVDALKGRGLSWEDMVVAQEPSPGLVDQAVRVYRHAGIEIVLGIGGGSVLDAAKAIAGLLPHGNSVMDHLEGVGPELPYRGPSLPFIAVPTTAGTGSEATKNAVLSMHGPDGFKKSFRHDLLVAKYAVVDPALLATCPPDLIAANGMDALTQLLESTVSTRANPLVDALALSGLGYVREGLLDWYEDGEKAAEGRAGMAYAALLSGITLAQVGLGSVHGLAAPLGALFPVPHGVACGATVAEATAINIRVLGEREPRSPALEKYAKIGRMFSRKHLDDDAARLFLVDMLREWTRKMKVQGLGAYGIREADLDLIVANSRGSSMKTNPIVLTDGEVREILLRCL